MQWSKLFKGWFVAVVFGGVVKCHNHGHVNPENNNIVTSQPQVTIQVVAHHDVRIEMGDSPQFTLSFENCVADIGLVAWPFINSSQFGAHVSVSNNYTAYATSHSLSTVIPLPHAGVARVTVVLVNMTKTLPTSLFNNGITVGMSLADAIADGATVATANTIHIDVLPRVISQLSSRTHVNEVDTNMLPKVTIGLQWEPYFSELFDIPGLSGKWKTHEAVPLVGKYSSFDCTVAKQHAIWMAESGIEWINVDWTNNLWGKAHFSNMDKSGWAVVNGTVFTAACYKNLTAQHIPVPKMALMMGMFNGPEPASVSALNEQIEYVRTVFSTATFVELDGLPLLIMFDYGQHLSMKEQINASGFTLRWIAAQLQTLPQLKPHGYWSWMDGVYPPIVAVRDNINESVTISSAFFNNSGWLGAPGLHSDRRGGATFIQQMTTAFISRPSFLMIHQWNEFAGSPTSATKLPVTGFYGDEYNVTLSDDIEPTSLSECGHVRLGDSACGGWGFQFLNLQRAFVAMLNGVYVYEDIHQLSSASSSASSLTSSSSSASLLTSSSSSSPASASSSSSSSSPSSLSSSSSSSLSSSSSSPSETAQLQSRSPTHTTTMTATTKAPCILAISSPYHNQPVRLSTSTSTSKSTSTSTSTSRLVDIRWVVLGDEHDANTSFKISISQTTTTNTTHFVSAEQASCLASFSGSDGLGRSLTFRSCQYQLIVPSTVVLHTAVMVEITTVNSLTPFMLSTMQVDTPIVVTQWINATTSVTFSLEW